MVKDTFVSMHILRTICRVTIAITGMAAVLLGALEHESLVLQADAAITEMQPGAACAKSPDIAGAPHESGTEGTYRSESHRHWTAPAPNDGPIWRIHAVPVGDRCGSAPLHLAQQARSRLIGVLALRL
jgi:hypothetical protein